MSRCQFLPLTLVLCAVGSADSVGAAQPKEGERHADFALANIADGKPAALSDFRGKKVLLIQFASW